MLDLKREWSVGVRCIDSGAKLANTPDLPFNNGHAVLGTLLNLPVLPFLCLQNGTKTQKLL